MASSKYFYLRSQMTGLVMEVKDEAQHPGAMVAMATQDEVERQHQLWYHDTSTDTIRSKHSDFCLDIDEEGSVCMQPYQPDSETQEWHIKDSMVVNPTSSRVLDVLDGCPDPGTQVCVADDSGTDSQQWTQEYTSVRYFMIKSKMHGKSLDVKGWLYGQPPKVGAKVIVYPAKTPPEDNQVWYEDQKGVIRSKMGNLALDSSDSKTIRVEEYKEGEAAHQWVRSGDRIVNRLDQSKCLDIRGKSKSNSAELCAYEYKGQSNQKWTFEYI